MEQGGPPPGLSQQPEHAGVVQRQVLDVVGGVLLGGAGQRGRALAACLELPQESLGTCDDGLQGWEPGGGAPSLALLLAGLGKHNVGALQAATQLLRQLVRDERVLAQAAASQRYLP